MDLSGRGSSAALDTVVLVVLVGTAVVVLSGAQPARPPTGRIAEETGDVLATATTTVNFSRSATLRDGRSITVRRRAHGTYAELLAAATVATPAIDGSLTGSGGALVRAVREATRRVVGARAANVEVRAVWRPYPGATLSSATVVGDSPPGDASVAVAVVTVPSGLPNVTSRALRAADRRGFDGVAAVAARAVVRGLFPRHPTRDAFHSEGPDRVLVLERYRRAASTLGTDVRSATRRRNVAAANRELATALAARIGPELRRRYDSPVAAARALRVHRVRILVRTWSP